MIARSTILLALLTTAVTAADLPRKANAPRESYPNADVIYDSVTTPAGQRLRTIVTRPRAAKSKVPVIFVAGWLSCDSVEAPPDTKDATGLIFRELAQLAGFSLFRIDKQGCGDSEGLCGDTDFESELAGYRAAFHALGRYDFIDSNRVYVFGISNGGGFAPLVPQSDSEQAQVRGYISLGGWVKTWCEHMLEIERRRFALSGKSPAEVNEAMKRAVPFYSEWLIRGRAVSEIPGESPDIAALWPGSKDGTQLYGRPARFYQQLQQLNLASAWSRVKVPALVMHGQYDWIMSREDPELIAQYVNANSPGAAKFVEVPEMGHSGQHYLSLADAFGDKQAPFDRKITQLIIDWLNQQEHRT